MEFKKGGMSTVIMNYFENIDKSRIHMDFVVNRRIEEEYKNELEANGSKVYLWRGMRSRLSISLGTGDNQ